MIDNIAELNLKPRWKQRLTTLQAMGADKGFNSLNAKGLPKLDVFKASFNFPAFFFGTFYYFYYGLFKKGLLLFGLSVMIAMLFLIFEVMLGFNVPSIIPLLFVSVIYAKLFNYDYYRKLIHGENMWEKFSIFNSPWAVLVFLFMVFSCTVLIIFALENHSNYYEVLWLDPDFI